MLGRVAKLHYEHGLTHRQIADMLGLSRVKVTRMLAEAREAGIVEIRVHTDDTLFTDVEVALSKRFELAQVSISPTPEQADDQLGAIGIVGAQLLGQYVRPGSVIAVGLSETVGAIAPHVRAAGSTDAMFVPAVGSRAGINGQGAADGVAHDLAGAFGGQAMSLSVPLLAASAETAGALLTDPTVTEVLRCAAGADAIFVGVGSIEPEERSHPIFSAMRQEEIDALIQAGAVGDISARFFDERGRQLSSPVDQRIVGLEPDAFSRIPVRIAVVTGSDKRQALRAALEGDLLTGLVTDLESARSLLEDAEA